MRTTSTTNPSMCGIFLTLVLLIGINVPTRAGNGIWTTQGPYGGEIYALKADPTNSNVVYAGTNRGGIFKSTDGGQTWVAINNGITDRGSNIYAAVYDIQIDPSNSSMLYIGVWGTLGKCVYRSTNGGTTWQASGQGIIGGGTYVGSLAINPTNTNIVYAGLSKFRGPALYKSINDGASWDTTSFSGPVSSILLNSAHPDILLVGTLMSGITKSTDGGVTWSATNLTTGGVGELEADPTDSNKAYAGTYEGIYKTTDAGNTWSLIGLDTLAVYSISIKQGNPSLIYAGTINGVFKSIDGGTTWEPASNGISHPGISSLEFGPQGKILAGSFESGGIFTSTDAGSSWASSNIGLTALEVRFILKDSQNSSVIHAGTAGRGMQKSTDGGLTWQGINTGLPRNSIAISGAIDANNSATLYAGVSQYPDRGVYKSTNSGDSWTPTTLVDQHVWSIAIDPFNTGTLYAGAYFDDIYKSTDGGAAWSPTQFGMSIATSIVIDPANPSTLYAVNNLEDKIFKSENGGSTWSQTGFVGESPWPVAIDPFTTTTLFAGGARGVYKSTDAGTTFTLTSLGDLSQGAAVMAIVVDPLNPDVIYAGASAGTGFWAAKVWKSTNGGTTWTELTNGLPANTNVRTLTITYDALRTTRTLYLGGDAWGGSLYAFSELVTAIGESNPDHVPAVFALSQNYPNPFNPQTTIQYGVPKNSYVTLKVYSVLGEEVVTLEDGFKEAGYHQISFDARTMSSGMYFYRLQAGEFTDIKRMLLLK